MNISIKKKIYLSFFLLVFLFVANGVASLITMYNNRQLAGHVARVIQPALENTGNFEDIVTQSKIYATNWVFIRYDEDNKDALKRILDSNYHEVKSQLNSQLTRLDDEALTDSINQVFSGFEKLIIIEKKIMALLHSSQDYDNPIKKQEAESLVQDKLLPQSSELIDALDVEVSYLQDMITKKDRIVSESSIRSRYLIFILASITISLGIFLSIYMAKIIINPINKIRDIINDLGKGIIRKVNHNSSKDEIGEIVSCMNNMSEKLEATAAFAHQIGNRNFDIPFQPLSNEDTLGKALIIMRDNLKSVDRALNEAQHIANIGSWERDTIKNTEIWSDELYRIFDLDRSMVNISFNDYFSFIHPEDKDHVFGQTKKYKEDHQPFSYECRIITKAGITKIILVLGKVVVNNNNEVIKTFGVVQDITSRKKAEEALHKSEANLLTIFNNTDVSYVLLDSNLNILYFNHHANNRFDIQSLGALEEGKYFINCLPEEKKSISIDRCRKVLRKECIEYETSFVNLNGTVSWNYMRMFPVSDNNGKIHGMVMAMSDITAQKQAELQREKVTADLLQRNNDLEQFAYIVSHNLRAPVANIIGFSEMLTDEDLTDDVQEIVTGLSSSSEKLDSVIMDLNEVLKVRNQLSENKITVHFSDLVRDILMSINSMIKKENAQIEFDFTEADELVTVKSYMHSIFYNLITNSIKYRQPDIDPVIKIRSCRHENKISILFSDNGMGIDLATKRDQVFGLYKRFHPHIEGKGLGLFMTKTQVETLSGRISIQSEVDKGTTFKIDFNI